MKHSSSAPDRQQESPGEIVIGVVGSSRGVRLLVAARTERAVYERVAEYVADAAHVQLFPSSAERVLRLLAAGECETAVADYFSSVGTRWDSEWLHVSTACVGAAIAAPELPTPASDDRFA